MNHSETEGTNTATANPDAQRSQTHGAIHPPDDGSILYTNLLRNCEHLIMLTIQTKVASAILTEQAAIYFQRPIPTTSQRQFDVFLKFNT